MALARLEDDTTAEHRLPGCWPIVMTAIHAMYVQDLPAAFIARVVIYILEAHKFTHASSSHCSSASFATMIVSSFFITKQIES